MRSPLQFEVRFEPPGVAPGLAEPIVVAFLSTGRCGTQWLAAGLRELYPSLEVEHEPIGSLYQPRHYFRRYYDPEAILELPEVRRHAARIEHASSTYGDRLAAVRGAAAAGRPLARRASHASPGPDRALAPGAQLVCGSARDDAHTRLATLGPRDLNVFQPHYLRSWDQLSPYEKCLFWSRDVDLFGPESPDATT